MDIGSLRCNVEKDSEVMPESQLQSIIDVYQEYRKRGWSCVSHICAIFVLVLYAKNVLQFNKRDLSTYSVQSPKDPQLNLSNSLPYQVNIICRYLNLVNTDSLEKTLMLGKIEGRRKGGNRGQDGWMASLTPWT